MTRRTAVLLFAAALAGALGLTAGITAWNPASPAQGAQVAAPPLDAIPGLGVGGASALRDDTIAYYEAWRRDTQVAACMARSGFQWLPEVAYPEEVVLEVADGLGVRYATRSGPAVDPAAANRAYLAGLPADRLDAYYAALYDEPAGAVQAANSSGGALPAGEDPATFASGGCVGQARLAVGSVWDLKRALAPALSRLQAAARDTDAFRQGVRSYSRCATSNGVPGVQSPADLESDGAVNPAKAAALRACGQLWTQATNAGLQTVVSRFRQQQRQLLDAQQAKYQGVLTQIRRDEEFRAFLADAARRAATAIGRT